MFTYLVFLKRRKIKIKSVYNTTFIQNIVSKMKKKDLYFLPSKSYWHFKVTDSPDGIASGNVKITSRKDDDTEIEKYILFICSILLTVTYYFT